jgi:hypothetical protein
MESYLSSLPRLHSVKLSVFQISKFSSADADFLSDFCPAYVWSHRSELSSTSSEICLVDRLLRKRKPNR